MAAIWKQLAVLAVLGGGAAFVVERQMSGSSEEAASSFSRPPPGVIVHVVEEGAVERAVAAVGSGRALRSVQLRVSDSGRVTERLFQPGDPVETGDALLRLEDAQQRAALAEAEAALTEARAAFERAEALRAQGRTTGSVFETAQSELLRAEARREGALDDLSRRTLTAPFAGVVGFTSIDPGAVVSSSDVIATLDDLSAIEADFALPERFFGDVEIGDPVRATSSAFAGDVFEGEVSAIDRRIDETSRSFRVRARFDNPDMRLPAGLFMRIELVLESRRGVLAPEEALISEGGTMYLYVIDADGRAERRDIAIGSRRIGEAEILRGLAPGERVVVRGLQKVRDGAPARVLNEDEAPASDAARPQAMDGGMREPAAEPAPAAASAEPRSAT